MGYESRLYVVDKSNVFDKSDVREGINKCWAKVVARFDLSVVHDYLIREIRNCSDTDCYFYSLAEGTGGREGKVLTDDYGKALKEISIGKMVEILSYAIANLDYCDRYKPVLAFLLSINQSEYTNLVVLHYGY